MSPQNLGDKLESIAKYYIIFLINYRLLIIAVDPKYHVESIVKNFKLLNNESMSSQILFNKAFPI